MPLRLAIISSILHPCYGGPPSVVRMHVEALRCHAEVTVFGCSPPNNEAEVGALFPNSRIFPETWPRRWFRGAGLYRALRHDAAQFDVFHAHMLWDHPTWATWRVARKAGKPFVVTPHGSISAVWRTQAMHKRLYRRLVLVSMFRDISALHVLNQAEANAFRSWGYQGNIVVIPNGLPAAEFSRIPEPGLAMHRWPILKGRRLMLYLGRLWGQKGLDILPEAWATARPANDWLLVLAGPDYRGYQQKLAARIRGLGSAQNILILGPVEAELKASLLAASECFVLPSHSEGFSMALIEAMALGVPSIFTLECHLTELALHAGGWEIPLGLEPLIEILQKVTEHSRQENKEFGNRAREFGRNHYTSEHVAMQLMNLYRSVLR
jgi:glycosyltransferase involved in cell wall biosynthesis